MSTGLGDFFIVSPGKVYVVVNPFRGVIEKEFDEGIHLVLPYLDKVIPYDIRLKEITVQLSQAVLQDKATLTFWYRLEPKKVNEIHRQIGPDYKEEIIEPTALAVTRSIIAEYTHAEVLEKKEEIQRIVSQRLLDILEKNGFLVSGVILQIGSLPQTE